MTLQASVPDYPVTPALEVSFRQHCSVCVLSLRGKLCSSSLQVLEGEFDQLGRTSCQEVVLDMTGLDAVDDAGCRVLTGLHHYVEARGGFLTAVGASEWVLAALADSPIFDS